MMRKKVYTSPVILANQPPQQPGENFRKNHSHQTRRDRRSTKVVQQRSTWLKKRKISEDGRALANVIRRRKYP